MAGASVVDGALSGGRGGGRRHKTQVEGLGGNYSSLKGVTLAPSMSNSLGCSQILSRGSLLTPSAWISPSHTLFLP